MAAREAKDRIRRRNGQWARARARARAGPKRGPSGIDGDAMR